VSEAVATTAYVGLGSSLGDRLEYLRRAARALAVADGVRVVALSSIYETPPAGGVAERAFLNAVAEIETTLEPTALLDRLKDIETALGRKTRAKWADREIDLDILLFGDRVVETERLRVPHPELARRSFAVVPLLELAPEARDPASKRKISDICAGAFSESEPELFPANLIIKEDDVVSTDRRY
jgi:2-amino-4-hydroxy-6-hydroxymethyldihydropteridine diphosphokinase